jgi:alpha-1,6-mannosyltransferase
MHILRVANFVSPTSGGIKTALRHWGEVYRARGHRVSLVIPGPGPAVTEESQGTVYRLPAVPIPGAGYSLMVNRAQLARLVEHVAPDRLEVSDRTTTRWLGRWAQRRGLPAVMISHEHLTGILQRRTPVPDRAAARLADGLNRRSAEAYDAIVCPSEFAAEEFRRLGVPAEVVPLGVDLEVFKPAVDHRRLAPDGSGRHTGTIHLVHCGRLAPEKNPALSVETLRVLDGRGVDAHLTVLGHGPLRARLMDASEDLPVSFHSYMHGRRELAAVIGRGDVAVAPGPLETFGLAALEALACGVPTVCPDEGALQEVVGAGGTAVPSDPERFADAVLQLAERPEARARARAQAETFSWPTSAERMLAVHERLASGGA